jgi:energy-coupling factor transport system permease protein
VSSGAPGRSRAPRWLHPVAWWVWALGLAAAALRTTNPLLLVLIGGVAAYVVAARRPDAPFARSFGAFLRLALVVVVIRVAFQVLFGMRLPGTTLFTLPSVTLPGWAAGVSLGGPVTSEALVAAITQGLRLGVLIVCFGAASSLASPYRLLRAMPAVLYEAGVAVSVAVAFAPQAVVAAGRVREAQRLRGRPARGLRGLRGLALPVLEGALERSVALAASMDARGYGRRADASPSTRRLTVVMTVVGLLVVAVGTYGLLDGSSPRGLGLPLLAAGCVVLAAALFAGGRRSHRTRYRPDPWRWPETTTAASGVVALVGFVLAARAGVLLDPPVDPLTWPTLPLVPAVAVLVAALPSVVAPPPPLALPAAPGPLPAVAADRAPVATRPPVAPAPAAPEVVAPAAPEVVAPAAPEVVAPAAPEVVAPAAPEVVA